MRTESGSPFPWQIFILFIAVTLVAYTTAIGGGFIWDDDFHVFANPNVVDLSGLYRIWFTTENQQYYPLVYSSFWLEWRLWGANPAGYHTVNIVIHSLNGALVYIILKRFNVRVALLTGLVFALHPVHVESVAWVSERKNVLSGLMYLLAFLSFLNFESGGERRWYGVSLLLFLLALFSKTVTCTLPAALILAGWMRGREITLRYLAGFVPFFAVGLVMGLVTIWWEMRFVGAVGEEWALSFAEKFMLPGLNSLFYFSKVIAPLNLTFIYPRWELDTSSVRQWIPLVIMEVAVIGAYAYKHRLGRAPFAAMLFFLLTLFPALGFFNVYPFRYSFVADHFQYLASIGAIALTLSAAALAIERYGAGIRNAKSVSTVVLLAVLGALTLNQTREYHDYETLMRATIEKNPGAWMAHTNLGSILAAKGEHEGAARSFARSIELNPSDPAPYYNMGNVLTVLDRGAEGERYYLEAIALKPDYAGAHFNLASLYYSRGRLPEAAAHYEEALGADPSDADTHLNLANTLATLGRLEEALGHYEEALRIRPGYEAAKRNQTIVLRRMKQETGGP